MIQITIPLWASILISLLVGGNVLIGLMNLLTVMVRNANIKKAKTVIENYPQKPFGKTVSRRAGSNIKVRL